MLHEEYLNTYVVGLHLALSPIYSDTTQLNWTSSWVELRRCKWGL